jgi:L-lactate dehydrogenase complex protein LldF
MQRLGRFGQRFLMRNGVITSLPGYLGGWTAVRDVFPIARQTFREWWREREREKPNEPRAAPERAKP